MVGGVCMDKFKKVVLVSFIAIVIVIFGSCAGSLTRDTNDYDRLTNEEIFEEEIMESEPTDIPKSSDVIETVEIGLATDFINYEEDFLYKTPVVIEKTPPITYMQGDGVEAIYYFKDAPSTYVRDDLENNFKTWATFVFYEVENYVDGSIEPYVEEYLRAKNTYKELPDKTFYYNDEVLAECYINEEDGVVSFIINSIFGYEDKLMTTYDLRVYEEQGLVQYETNNQGYTTSEILYDVDGNNIDEVLYSYKNGIPFAFIESQRSPEIYEDRYMMIPKTLGFDKFWFYEDSATFNEKGEMTLYESKMHYPQEELGGYEYSVKYENDKIKKITNLHTEKSEFYDSEFEDYIECFYEDDKIDIVRYVRTGEGTSDSSGTLRYDDLGRIVTNSFYYTSGSGVNYYLYEGDSRRPFAIISVYGMAQSGGQFDGFWYVLIGSEMATFQNAPLSSSLRNNQDSNVQRVRVDP